MSPQLAILLKVKFSILSVGTCRVNRKGWPRNQLNMTKEGLRGEHKIFYDNINQVCCMQWRDTKVVNLVSTLNDSHLRTCERQDGNTRLLLSVPNDYNEYSSKMYGVDKGDQFRAHFGGFANRAHFKKWYVKVYLAILDCAVLNAYSAWNMSCEQVSGRNKLHRHSFMWALSEQLLNYEDEVVPVQVPVARASVCEMIGSGVHVPIGSNQNRLRCCVCQLEVSLSDEITEKGLRSASVGECGCDDCLIAAHTSIQRDEKRKIHTFPGFEKMTCFEIAHHSSMSGLWRRTRIGYTTRPNHHIMRQLKRVHGLTPTVRRPRSRLNERTQNFTGEVLFPGTGNNQTI